jgi:hypothetical protein
MNNILKYERSTRVRAFRPSLVYNSSDTISPLVRSYVRLRILLIDVVELIKLAVDDVTASRLWSGLRGSLVLLLLLIELVLLSRLDPNDQESKGQSMQGEVRTRDDSRVESAISDSSCNASPCDTS